MKPCTVDGCDRKSRAKGMCNVHYQRRLRVVQSAGTPKKKPGPQKGWHRPDEFGSWCLHCGPSQQWPCATFILVDGGPSA